MSRNVITIVFVMLMLGSIYGDEIDELQVEVQLLREKVTQLNNSTNRTKRNWGSGIFLGVPVGLYNDDAVVGLELGIPVTDNLIVKLDAHMIFENQHEDLFLIASPSAGLIGHGSVMNNLRFYGGFLFGITKELNQTKRGPFFQFKGLGGVEFFSSQSGSYFIETGGGGAITNENINYTRGVFIMGGSRFFF